MPGAPTSSVKNSFPSSFQENTAAVAAGASSGYYANNPGYNPQAYYQPVYPQAAQPPASYAAQQPGFNAYSAQSNAYGNIYGGAPTAYAAQPPPPAGAAPYSAFRAQVTTAPPPAVPFGAPTSFPAAFQAGGAPPPAASYNTSAPTAHHPPANTYVPTKPTTTNLEPVAASTDVQPSDALLQTSGAILPNSSGVKSRANVPMGAVYTVMEENSLPVVNPQGMRLVRCSKCRAYVNCYVVFLENGSKWSCNLCSTINDVPNEYYSSLTAMGERQDKYERPELCQAAVEFLASPDYMMRPPMPPMYVVLLDVSRQAVQCGFVQTVCQTLKRLIQDDRFAGMSRAQFGILTYDANIHLYTPGSGTTPQISVITGNSKDVFLPNSDLMIHIKDNQEKLANLLDNIPMYWADQTSDESCVAGALTAVRLLLRSTGGKVLMCQSALPLAPELGLNPSHDMRKRDSKGRVLAHGALPDPIDGLKSSSPFFSNLAASMASNQTSVDLFIAPSGPIQMDLATISGLSRNSGGQLYYYAPTSAPIAGSTLMPLTEDAQRQLACDLEKCISSVVGWEGVMRVRCSKGWKLTKYHGNHAFRALDLMMLPSFTSDQTVSIQFDISESVTTEKKFYAQAAVLYTNNNGERRIRVVNHSRPTSPNLRDISSGLNLLPTLYLIAQNAQDEALASKLADARSYIHGQVRNLNSLLSLLTSPQDGGSEAAQQQCNLFSQGLSKCTAFRDSRDITADERVQAWNLIRSQTPQVLYQYLLPTLMECSQIPQTENTNQRFS